MHERGRSERAPVHPVGLERYAAREALSSFRLSLLDAETVEGGVAELEPPDLPPAPAVPGLQIGRAGAVICGAAIAVEAGATVGGRAYAWAADGWLVRIR